MYQQIPPEWKNVKLKKQIINNILKKNHTDKI